MSALLALLMLCGGCALIAPPGHVVWIGDAATGDLSQYQDTPWNVDGGGVPPDVVSHPLRYGSYSIRARILGKGGANTDICCGSRSELVPKLPDMHPGDDLWFGFSTYLGQGFPIDAEWQTIAQWHEDSAGSPPLEISAQDGRYALSGGYGHPGQPMPFVEPLGPAVAGEWVDWLLHIKFSPDPTVGYVDLWQNGRHLLDEFHPKSGTMYPTVRGVPDVYLKVGYYRNAAISTPGTVYYSDWRVATTRAALSASR